MKKKKKDNETKENIKVFRTIKVPLKKILKNYDIIQPKIEENVLKVNDFAIRTYEFIKLFCLYQFENNKEIPTINKKFVIKIFNIISESIKPTKKIKEIKLRKLRGKYNIKPKEHKESKTIKRKYNKEPKEKFDYLQVFYNNIFSKIYTDKLNSYHLSYLLSILAEDIIRSFETNIKINFIKYINKYINVVIKVPLALEIKESKLKKVDRKVFYTELNSIIKNIKTDLINLKCEKSFIIFHDWINQQIKSKFNFKVEKNLAYDVKISPQKYIIPSILLNKEIEILEKKPYQVFCQRSNISPKSITLNTCGIVEIIDDKNKFIFSYKYTEMIHNTKKYKKHIWQTLLKLENKKIFNQKDYIFYNQIQTDGISCSLLFIHKNYYSKKFGDKLPEYDDDIDIMIKELDNLTKEECINYHNRKIVGIDPGKHKIITMIDENNNIYSYSNCRRRFETYTKRSNQITLNERKESDIIEIETELYNYSKRTLQSNKFIDYLTERKKHFTKLQAFYQRPLFRKMALRRFIRTKSSEDRMLNEIEKKYGKKDTLLLGLGDWSKNCNFQMKGCMPSINKSIIRILRKRFDLVSVDEFRTSKLYNKDFSKTLVNVKVKGKSIHSLLTPKENPEGVILNRDTNASKNILFLVKEYLYHQRRPEEFKRPKRKVDLEV